MLLMTDIFEKSALYFDDIAFENTTTYESNVEYALRFMIDCDISGGTWVEIPAQSYSVKKGDYKLSTCQIEIYTEYTNIINHPSIGNNNLINFLIIQNI